MTALLWEHEHTCCRLTPFLITVFIMGAIGMLSRGYPTGAAVRRFQYAYTERNNQKYTSLRMVWPKALHRPNHDGKPLLFCIVPHGAAPMGVCAYPMFSKLWNNLTCHWTVAPVVLHLPLIGGLLKRFGSIPAKAPSILHTLEKRKENVGVVLDGIAGMFQGYNPDVQKAHGAIH